MKNYQFRGVLFVACFVILGIGAVTLPVQTKDNQAQETKWRTDCYTSIFNGTVVTDDKPEFDSPEIVELKGYNLLFGTVGEAPILHLDGHELGIVITPDCISVEFTTGEVETPVNENTSGTVTPL